jgi:hypothetical protein
VKPILKNLSAGRAKLQRVSQLAAIEEMARSAATGTGGGDPEGKFQGTKFESLLRTRASLQALLAAEKARFDDWVAHFKVVPKLQGWLVSPQGLDKVGSWQPVEETPAELELESSFPLYLLKPDPNDPTHAGRYDTVYFGVLPTASHDHDSIGRARFDDREFYEVRCWALRHLKPHDPDQPCPCPDGIFWSVPTRPYKLASHFDLTGTSNQPVTIQVPDLNDLAAQAQPHLGVGFAKPAGSLMVSGDSNGKPLDQGFSNKFEICFLPIPLITIVATFVFDLFLPVVMLLFQLWWMLALKFCLPPEIDVAAGINAEIGADGRIDVSGDATANARIEADIQAAVDVTISGPDIKDQKDVSIKARYGDDVAKRLHDLYSPIAVANLELGASDASSAATAPSVTANIEFEPEVIHA